MRKSEVLKKPAAAFGAIINGVCLSSANLESLTFHTPIAEGSESSTFLNSPERKNPITEFPLVPSAFVFLYIGPESATPSKS